MIDYKSLLAKYISLVRLCERTSYISLLYREPGEFTDEEWAALESFDGSYKDDQFAKDTYTEKLSAIIAALPTSYRR